MLRIPIRASPSTSCSPSSGNVTLVAAGALVDAAGAAPKPFVGTGIAAAGLIDAAAGPASGVHVCGTDSEPTELAWPMVAAVPAGPKPRWLIGIEPARAGAKPNPPTLPNDPTPAGASSESAAGKFIPTPGKLMSRPPAPAPKPLEPKPAASEPKSATPLDDDDAMSVRLSSAPRPDVAPVPALVPRPLPVDPARPVSALSPPDAPEMPEVATVAPLPDNSPERPDADCVGCESPCNVEGTADSEFEAAVCAWLLADPPAVWATAAVWLVKPAGLVVDLGGVNGANVEAAAELAA